MSGQACNVCSEELWNEFDRSRHTCSRCRKNFGLAERPPRSQRPPLPCRRCSHTILIRARVRERATETGEYGKQYLAPLSATYHRSRKTSFWTGRTKVRNTPDLSDPAGELEAFICRKCGYVEWYAQSPDDIPIGPEYGTELVDVGGNGRGPFR